jgi:hypothetical protein
MIFRGGRFRGGVPKPGCQIFTPGTELFFPTPPACTLACFVHLQELSSAMAAPVAGEDAHRAEELTKQVGWGGEGRVGKGNRGQGVCDHIESSLFTTA